MAGTQIYSENGIENVSCKFIYQITYEHLDSTNKTKQNDVEPNG
jgi:hypothetical protein